MKTRIISAAVLLPILLVFLIWLPKVWTVILLSLICAIGAYELLMGTKLVKNIRLVAYSALLAIGVCFWSFYGVRQITILGLDESTYYLVSFQWLLAGILVFTAILFTELLLSKAKLPIRSMAMCYVAGLVIPFLLCSLVRIFALEKGRYLVYAPFVAAFMSDTAAYFVGKYFGKRKLSPVISPKKTVEGLFGGIAGAVVGMLIYAMILQFACGLQVNFWAALLYGVLGSGAGVFGDLCFSAIKRQVGIKDYGNLIPGHGGVLDRFDSVVIVAPVIEMLMIIIPMAV